MKLTLLAVALPAFILMPLSTQAAPPERVVHGPAPAWDASHADDPFRLMLSQDFEKRLRGERVETALTVAGSLALVAGAALTFFVLADTIDNGIFPCGINLFGEPSAEDLACEAKQRVRRDRNQALLAVGIPTLVGGSVMVTVGQTVNFGHKDKPESRSPALNLSYSGRF